MVSTRDGVPEPVKRLGARLKSALLPFVDDEKQAEAARLKFEKAVFNSQYSVDQFEDSLDTHRHKMRELGEAIRKCVKEVRKNWKKAQKLGPHEAKDFKAIAKTYFKQVIALEERMAAHLQQYKQKLHVLTAWRQYKIQNDIGSEVPVSEVEEFIGENYDQVEVNDHSFEAEQGELIGEQLRDKNDGEIVSEEEEQLLNDWVDDELPEPEAEEADQEDVGDGEELIEEMGIDGPAGDDSDHGGGSNSTGNSEIDDDIKDFVGDEFH